jgi:hypothetical protein
MGVTVFCCGLAASLSYMRKGYSARLWRVQLIKEALWNFVNYIWTNRKVWSGPLILAFLIVAAMFIIASGPVEVPFIYRQMQ